MFEVHAFLAGDVDQTVFDSTMHFLPRLEEMISIGTYTFKVKTIRYILNDGTFSNAKVRMALELI